MPLQASPKNAPAILTYFEKHCSISYLAHIGPKCPSLEDTFFLFSSAATDVGCHWSHHPAPVAATSSPKSPRTITICHNHQFNPYIHLSIQIPSTKEGDDLVDEFIGGILTPPIIVVFDLCVPLISIQICTPSFLAPANLPHN